MLLVAQIFHEGDNFTLLKADFNTPLAVILNPYRAGAQKIPWLFYTENMLLTNNHVLNLVFLLQI